MGYSFRLTHRQDSTYHGLWYTSHGTLAGTRNSSMGPSWRIDLTTQRTLLPRRSLSVVVTEVIVVTVVLVVVIVVLVVVVLVVVL